MNIESSLAKFMKQEALPEAFKQTAVEWFIPLLSRITNKVRLHQRNTKMPFMMGINGAQGSGKSTLASLLVSLCEDTQGLSAVSMSLDDFYATKQARVILSEDVHPLFATRGVPGTHDIALMQSTLNSLLRSQPCAIPRFDKAIDNRAPAHAWTQVTKPIDIIILEGWCVGAKPQSSAQLIEAVNDLEFNEDANQIWRNYVNQKLESEYQQVFSRLDYLVMLKAPSFQQILDWRCEQEHKMQQKNEAKGLPKGGMSDQEIALFIQHYQRITEHGLVTLPAICDEVFELNKTRRILTCNRK